MEANNYHFIDELLEDRGWKAGVVFSRNEKEAELYIETTSYIEKAKFKTFPELESLAGFLNSYNGLTLFEYENNGTVHSILKFVSHKTFHAVNRKYKNGGIWNDFFKIGKSKDIYQNEKDWIVIAEIEDGPKCLTTFLAGENAGSIFFFEPQPHFNITKPIARSIDQFASRLSTETLETINKFNAHFTITKDDGSNYGYRIFNIIRE